MKSPVYLLADVGGTHVRFATATGSDAPLECIETYACADYGRFEDALTAYCTRRADGDAPKPVMACFAVAASVHEERIVMTNSPWQFSRRDLSASLGMPLALVNDFSAQAWGLPALQPADTVAWQVPKVRSAVAHQAQHARTVVGPGTGFGGASLVGEGTVVESEPGHVGFSPVTPHELALLEVLWQRIPRVSVEHLLSGPGLANLYWANARLQGQEGERAAPDIVKGAIAGDALCLRTVQDFTGILGSVCGDIALAMGSLGGFYLSGAMLEKMDTLIDKALFLARFQDKGPFRGWCAQVPVFRVTAPTPGLLGCATYCRTHYAGIA